MERSDFLKGEKSCPLLPPFIVHGTSNLPIITAAWRIIEIIVVIYDEHFSRQYGFWRFYVEQAIRRYLDCGDLHNGFARVPV